MPIASISTSLDLPAWEYHYCRRDSEGSTFYTTEVEFKKFGSLVLTDKNLVLRNPEQPCSDSYILDT